MKQPRQFKTQAEIWQFLLDGNKVANNKNLYFFEDGILYFKPLETHSYAVCTVNFTNPCLYQEHIKPSWQDKLDGTVENGVWCWYGDNPYFRSEYRMQLIFRCNSNGEGYYGISGCPYKYAIPVTNEEFDNMKHESRQHIRAVNTR